MDAVTQRRLRTCNDLSSSRTDKNSLHCADHSPNSHTRVCHTHSICCAHLCLDVHILYLWKKGLSVEWQWPSTHWPEIA